MSEVSLGPQLTSALCVGACMLGSIAIANVMLDRGTPQYVTRKVAHVAAGAVFLLAPLLYSSMLIPLVLSMGFTVLMAGARRWRPDLIRGVGGDGRPHTLAEVWYPFACAVSVFVGWGLLRNPWLGVLPALFLGFGDAITGLVRNFVYRREVKGAAGSLAMLAVCSALALLVHPYWIGLAGAVTATIFERITVASPRWDDNPALTIGSSLVMAALYWSFVGA